MTISLGFNVQLVLPFSFIKMANLILMHRRIQGHTHFMCNQFGVDGKLYVELLYVEYVNYMLKL